MKLSRNQIRQLISESLKLSFKPQATAGEKHQMKQVLSDLLGLDDIDYDIEDIEYAVLPHEDTYYHQEQEHQARFTNELGNEIEIKIEDFGCGSADQLTISIIGPNSETENTITRMEAEYLHRLLGDYLDKAQASIE